MSFYDLLYIFYSRHPYVLYKCKVRVGGPRNVVRIASGRRGGRCGGGRGGRTSKQDDQRAWPDIAVLRIRRAASYFINKVLMDRLLTIVLLNRPCKSSHGHEASMHSY